MAMDVCMAIKRVLTDNGSELHSSTGIPCEISAVGGWPAKTEKARLALQVRPSRLLSASSQDQA